jgi:hypothetical protein
MFCATLRLHRCMAITEIAIVRWLGQLPERLEAARTFLVGENPPGRASAASRANCFGGQASKSIRWMPWHQEAMKDVVKLRKATVSRIQASTRRSPNRETDIE